MALDPFFFDSKDPSFVANPYPIYKILREEAPVYYSERYKTWFISTYNHAKMVFGKEEYFGFQNNTKGQMDLNPSWESTVKNARGFEGYLAMKNKVIESQGLWIASREGVDHHRIRKEFNPSFSPTRLKISEPLIRNRITQIIRNHKGKSGMSIVSNLSAPLTTKIFLDLLGLSQDRSAWIQSHSLSLSKLFFLDISSKEKEQGLSTLIDFMEFFRKELRDNPHGDSSTLIACLLEGKCMGRTSMDEILANLSFFILAGIQASVYLISNMFYCLQQNPEQLRVLKANPSLIERAVEETLRCETPNSFTERYVLKGLEIGGHNMEKGQKVIILTGAANRDERVFDNSEKFDILRNPNPHLAFGFGTRYCIGSYLARLEAKLVLEEMLKNFPDFSIDADQTLDWYYNFRLRGLNELKIRLY